MKNFNEIFMTDVASDNIESHKKSGLHPFYKLCIFGKTAGEGDQIDPT